MKVYLTQYRFIILLIGFLGHAFISSAQSQRQYTEHEVFDLGNGTKVEVLKCRGEGENEECNVIYYTERRQTGKRVWEKTGKLREMERAAKLALAQAKEEAKKPKPADQNTQSFSTQDAEKLNLAEEKRQQEEALTRTTELKPKAVMLPKATHKKDSSQNIGAAKKPIVKKTFLPIDSTKLTKGKTSQSVKARQQAIKDSIQRVAAAKRIATMKAFALEDSLKASKARTLTSLKATSKTNPSKDTINRIAAEKKVPEKKVTLQADSSKINQAVRGRSSAQQLKDSSLRIASIKRVTPTDTGKITKPKVTPPVTARSKTVTLKDSSRRKAATTKANQRKTPLDTTGIATPSMSQLIQTPKATYPVKNKTATSIDGKSTNSKPSTLQSSLTTPGTNVKETAKRNAATADSVTTKQAVKKLPNNNIALPDPSGTNQLASTKPNTAKANNNVLKTPVGAGKKFLFDSVTAVRVAVFAPLYIDDAFIGDTYNLGKSNLPKNILTGLEFYNGVMMAIDSLSQEGVNAEVRIYDTRQSTRPLNQILASTELNNVELVIADITNTSELKMFSEFAKRTNIPLISARYPNTVGVVENPFFVLLNSSFSVHLEGLYKYLQRFHPTDFIVGVRRAGATEDFIKNYFVDANKNSRTPLNIKWIDLKENFTIADLAKNLDTVKNNVVFVASPNEAFGLKVVKTLSASEIYRCTAIGMPTWDAIKELNSRDCDNVEIVYSTPFLYASNNANLNIAVVKKYRDKYYSRPSDMAYKGFETTYHFTKLLSKYQTNLVNNLSAKEFTLFNQFDIQPVKVRNTSIKPDYLENKKLYFIKKQGGSIKSIM